MDRQIAGGVSKAEIPVHELYIVSHTLVLSFSWIYLLCKYLVNAVVDSGANHKSCAWFSTPFFWGGACVFINTKFVAHVSRVQVVKYLHEELTV